MGYRVLQILTIALAVLFLQQGHAQKISQFAEPAQIQAAARALQENILGHYEFPRVLPESKMATISSAAEKRILQRSSLQTFSTTPALVASARRALTDLNGIGVAIASLYGGNIHFPQGLNYFTVQNGKISDQNFWLHLQKADLSPRRITNVVDVTVSFENPSDMYRALEALLRADTRRFIEVVGFKDLMIRPLRDGDRHLEILLRKNGHVSTLRFELNSFLQARAYLKNEIVSEKRKQVFDQALSMAQKSQVRFGTSALRHNAAVKNFLRKELALTNLEIQRLETIRSQNTAPSSDAVFSKNPNDVLCPGWQNVTVDHKMPGADKLRTFLWGLSQPPCHPDRIRAGHLLYKNIYDSYDGFQFSNNPEHRTQQLLLRSIYLATADYLRARPTAPKNQMCRPEEKIRIYRGIAAMPLTRAPNATTGTHLAPMFGDQLVSGLKTLGLVNRLDQPLVQNRDLGELSFENLGRMKNLTWDYVEGVAHGWKFVLGHQRSSGYPDKDKNGIPEEVPNPPLPLPIPFPFPFHPGPLATFMAAPTAGIVPGEPPKNPYDDWYEPGKSWYKINAQLQRILSHHTATSTFSPFLSASFSERMGHAYGPIMIVMDVCPERMLPNFELTGGYGGEEELYLPFFVLPEEIIRFEGRECWIARSKPGLDLLPPEEREKYLREVEKLCEATYPLKPSEPVNATTKKWRSYFRNFLAEHELNYWADTAFQIKSSQKILYRGLADGLKPSPLNPAGEMTLARWREIARRQVGGFQNCESSKNTILKLENFIEGHQKEVVTLKDRILKIPDPRKDPQYWPLEPPWPATDWRLDQIQWLESNIQNFKKYIVLEKSASSGPCGTR